MSLQRRESVARIGGAGGDTLSTDCNAIRNVSTENIIHTYTYHKGRIFYLIVIGHPIVGYPSIQYYKYTAVIIYNSV